MEDDQITEEQTREALERSGYVLEVQVEQRLRKTGYYVQANSAYPDPDTGKPRELDIFAINAQRAGRDRLDFLFPVLLIECVNNPQPIAFFTKRSQVAELHAEEVRFSGLPVKIAKPAKRDSWVSLAEFVRLSAFHHYCRPRVATQYCSFARKKGSNDWLALHEGPQFDSFVKLAHALEHAIDEHFEGWLPGPKEWVNLQVYYPLLIVQGRILEVGQGRHGLTMKPVKHVQFRRSSIWRNEETTYQVDVITNEYLGQFLHLVESEVARIARTMRRRRVVVDTSVRRIQRRLQRLRTPKAIRKVLEH